MKGLCAQWQRDVIQRLTWHTGLSSRPYPSAPASCSCHVPGCEHTLLSPALQFCLESPACPHLLCHLASSCSPFSLQLSHQLPLPAFPNPHPSNDAPLWAFLPRSVLRIMSLAQLHCHRLCHPSVFSCCLIHLCVPATRDTAGTQCLPDELMIRVVLGTTVCLRL